MQQHVIRPVVFDIHSRLERHFRTAEDMLEELKHHENARVRIAANAEMRHSIELARRTMVVAVQAEAMRDFQAAVLDALADAGVVVRSKVMGLFEARALETLPDEEQPANPQ